MQVENKGFSCFDDHTTFDTAVHEEYHNFGAMVRNHFTSIKPNSFLVSNTAIYPANMQMNHIV